MNDLVNAVRPSHAQPFHLRWLAGLFIWGILIPSLPAQRAYLGAAAVYGDDIKSPGINARTTFFVLPELCLGPELTLFRPHEETVNGEALRRSLWEINLNAHYLLMLSKRSAIYPLLGLNYSRETETAVHQASPASETLSFFGLNLGMGLHGEWRHVLFLAEYDRLIGELPQNTFSIGFYAPLGGGGREE